MKSRLSLRSVSAKSLVLASIAAVLILALHESGSVAEGVVQPGARFYRPYVFRFCIEDFIEIHEEMQQRVPPIVVGCEIIDCCPGCPGPGPLDWRVLLRGGPVEAVTLQFENLPPAESRRLDIEGKAQWVDPSSLRIGKGETTIKGFAARTSGPPPTALPRIALDQAAIKRASDEKSAYGAEQAVGDIEFVVEQLLGDVVVTTYALRYRLIWCPHPGGEDEIDLDLNNGPDNAVLFVDANDSTTCFDDQIYRGQDIIGVGNLHSPGTCNADIIVFSDGDAVQLFENVSVWTSNTGDLFKADLTPDLWQVPVTVWISVPNAQVSATLARAQNEIAQSDFLYDTNHAGIAFAGTTNYQTVTNANQINTITNAATNVWNNGNCAPVANITGNPAIFNAGQLNVYYVNGAFTGWYCAGSNVIAIGTNAQPETLAHEFGHSFSLRHTNNVDYDADGTNDFSNANIMWGGGFGRTDFSEGQDFRMTVNQGSTLNTNGVRTTGATRSCPDNVISATCPWIGLDAVPN